MGIEMEMKMEGEGLGSRTGDSVGVGFQTGEAINGLRKSKGTLSGEGGRIWWGEAVRESDRGHVFDDGGLGSIDSEREGVGNDEGEGGGVGKGVLGM